MLLENQFTHMVEQLRRHIFKEKADQRPTIDELAKAQGPKWTNEVKTELNAEHAKIVVKELLDIFSTKAGGDVTENLNDFYRSFTEDIIVRRESPIRLVELVRDNKDLKITFDNKGSDKDVEYSNAVEWSGREGSRGLENAWLEGFHDLYSVVTVAGYKPDHLTVKELHDASRIFHDVAEKGGWMDRSLVRSVSGNIEKEDLEFVVIRARAA